MKKLNEYETPITDDAEYHCGGGVHAVNAETARDLKRKLAMCRDALAEVFAKTKDLKSYAIAKQALEQTK